MEELGVKRIYAHSPQAKGRIERLFKTLQDRLIKEMRLKGIKSVKEANKFLKTYLPKYNKRFSLKAQKPEDLPMPVPNGDGSVKTRHFHFGENRTFSFWLDIMLDTMD